MDECNLIVWPSTNASFTSIILVIVIGKYIMPPEVKPCYCIHNQVNITGFKRYPGSNSGNDAHQSLVENESNH